MGEGRGMDRDRAIFLMESLYLHAHNAIHSPTHAVALHRLS